MLDLRRGVLGGLALEVAQGSAELEIGQVDVGEEVEAEGWLRAALDVVRGDDPAQDVAVADDDMVNNERSDGRRTRLRRTEMAWAGIAR